MNSFNPMAIAITLHLLAVIVWVGGMFFAYMALRPVAASQLEPPQRMPLWVGTFTRFFPWVWAAVILLPVTGYWMIFNVFGGFKSTALYIHLMQGLGWIMIAVFLHVYFAPYRRLQRAVAAQDFVAAGKADIGFTQVDAAWDAIKGQGKFAGPLPVKALAVLYPNNLHAVTIEGTGITKIEDLKGKRVSVGSAGSATEVFAVRVLEAAGLDAEKDITKEKLGAAESVNAMKDRKIDAFFWVGGLPTAAITDLAATPNTTIKFLDVDQYGDKMNAKYGPLYAAATIPKATYKGMTADAKNLTVWNILAVNDNMPEDLAYKLAKLVFEKNAELGQVHAEGKNIKAELQSVKRSGIPFHKGTLKYLAEKGFKVE